MSAHSANISPFSHWPQRSLFGSNLDASKNVQNVDFQELDNNKWEIKKSKAKSHGAEYYSENLLEDIRNRLKQQEINFKNSDKALQNVYLKALNFENRLKQPPKNRAKSSYDIRAFEKSKIEKISVKKPSENFKSSKISLEAKASKRAHSVNTENDKSFNLLSNIRTHPMKQHFAFSDGTQLEKYEIDGKNYEVYEFAENPSACLGSSLEYNANHVPQNIKHKYGTKVTTQLLKDPLKVNQTLVDMNEKSNFKKHQEQPKEAERPNSGAVDPKKHTTYYNLSNFLRHSVSHGYPDLMAKSTKQRVHNAAVSKEYLDDPENYRLANRRKKDWLGKWTELNVIRERLYKGLADINAEKEKSKKEKIEP